MGKMWIFILVRLQTRFIAEKILIPTAFTGSHPIIAGALPSSSHLTVCLAVPHIFIPQHS
jgi:hypothetical protein